MVVTVGGWYVLGVFKLTEILPRICLHGVVTPHPWAGRSDMQVRVRGRLGKQLALVLTPYLPCKWATQGGLPIRMPGSGLCFTSCAAASQASKTWGWG